MKSFKGKSSGRATKLALVFVLIGMLVAGTGMAFAADPPAGAKVEANPPPAEVVEKSNVVFDNHVLVLQLRLQCAQVMDQIRHKIQELRAAGTQIPEETRAAIKESRDAIQAGKDVLRATVAQMEAERNALHEDLLAKNWTGVLEHLDNIIAIQGTRLDESAHILAQLQNILNLLESVG
jgi:hypothetical protein